MKQKLFQFLIILVTISFLTGCWSKRELNELAIAVGLGIDKTKEGYELTLQFVNPGELGGKTRSGRSEVFAGKIEGKTIFEALRKFSTTASRKVYMAHLRQVVFGEEAAKEGIADTLEFLARDHEIRTDFYIAIAKGRSAYEVLSVQTALESLPASKLFASLENSEQVWAGTKTVQLDELITSIVSKGKQPVLTGISIIGKPEEGNSFSNVESIAPNTILTTGSLGVFKEDKLIGWLTTDESKGFNYITDNVKNTVITIPYSDGNISIELIRSKTKVKGRVEKRKPIIDIYVMTEGDIGEVMSNSSLFTEGHLQKIEEEYRKALEEMINSAVKRIKTDFHSDIFGFGEVIYRSDPKAWKQLKKGWDQQLENLEVNIHVRAKIRRLGANLESFQIKGEE